MKKLLVEAKAQHAAGVILDLRSDGGGSLDEAISLTGLFIPKGPVVQVRSAERDVKVQADEDPAIEYDGPLLVMVNRLSASASEIVAAALQDYHRAVIVGDVATHGKGTVQTVYHLDTFLRNSTVFKGKAPGSLKFTVAKFYRITGGSTQQRGVTPDVTFPAYTDFMELGETNLPNSLGWDEIAALDITPVADVRPYLDALKKQSQPRVAKDPDFQNWLKNVRHYGDLKEVKTLPLNLEKRKALQAEEERFAKEIRQTAAGRNRKHAKKDDSEGPPPRDLVLDESVRILADLISLENKATPSPVVATGTTPTPPEVK